MLEELGQRSNGIRSGLAVGPCPEAKPDVGTALLTGEDPSVSGKDLPWFLLPQDDGREIDDLWEVRADGESPQNHVGIDEPCRRGDFAGGTVGADHEVGVQFSPVLNR